MNKQIQRPALEGYKKAGNLTKAKLFTSRFLPNEFKANPYTGQVNASSIYISRSIFIVSDVLHRLKCCN